MPTVTTTITLHSTTDAQGNRIEYARIIERRPQLIVGLSVLLHRLSPEQRRIAKLTLMA
jgi:hypothetical protein